jgi:hypothetical protein
MKRRERRDRSKPYTTKKPAAKKAATKAAPKAVPKAQEIIINNPASQAKLDLIQEKTREVEEAEKVKELSSQMGNYFRELASCFKELTAGTSKVGDTVENWDLIFQTMGSTHRDEQSTLVLFETSKVPHARGPM